MGEEVRDQWATRSKCGTKGETGDGILYEVELHVKSNNPRGAASQVRALQ